MSYFDAKNQTLSAVKASVNVSGMTVCGRSNKLLYWFENTAYVYDPTKLKHDLISFQTPLQSNIVTADCADHEDKMLLMALNGEIRQFNTSDYLEIAQFDGDYDAYDELNSGHIIQYLAENEFLYGGKADLKIRPSTTETEIRSNYKKRLVRINSARSWLDKSSIKQVVFAEAISEEDLTLYKTLFDKDIANLAQRRAFLSFLNEEEADPLLVANKPSLFNSLSGGITVIEDGNIMLVKQNIAQADQLYTTTTPNWEHLGFEVKALSLGSHGFEPRIYRQLDNAQLTADIVNMTLSEDSNWLVTTLSNGEVSYESLSPDEAFNELFDAHTNQVSAAALTTDRQLLATAGRDGLINIWRLTVPQLNDEESWISLEKELKGYAGNVLDLAFINDDLLISTGSDQTIKLWDLEGSAGVKNEMLGHTDTVKSAHYDESLHQIVSASDDGSIRVWDINKAEQIKSFKGAKGVLSSYDVNSNILAYTRDDRVMIKNIVSGNTLGRISFDQKPLSIALGFDGAVCYLIYPESISVFQVSSGEIINDIPLSKIKGIKKVFTSSDSHDLFLMTETDISIINMGRYALYGIENDE